MLQGFRLCPHLRESYYSFSKTEVIGPLLRICQGTENVSLGLQLHLTAHTAKRAKTTVAHRTRPDKQASFALFSLQWPSQEKYSSNCVSNSHSNLKKHLTGQKYFNKLL